jgi:hypothetical protein
MADECGFNPETSVLWVHLGEMTPNPFELGKGAEVLTTTSFLSPFDFYLS